MRIPIEIKVPKACLEFTSLDLDHHSLLSGPPHPGLLFPLPPRPLRVLFLHRRILHNLHFFIPRLISTGVISISSLSREAFVNCHLASRFGREQEVHKISYHSNEVCCLSVCLFLLCCFPFSVVLGMEPRPLHMLNKYFTPELHPQSLCSVAFLHVSATTVVIVPQMTLNVSDAFRVKICPEIVFHLFVLFPPYTPGHGAAHL